MRLVASALMVWALGLGCVQAVAQESETPTLPPVTVTPPAEESTIFPDGMPSYFNGNARDGISWSSNAIRNDAQLVGPYAQPVWTTQRPFAASRVYVLPPGQAQVEQWVRPTWHDGEPTEYRFLEEFAIGLPGRFQLDIYERWNVEPNDDNEQKANHEGVQIELRWAVADWGVIPLNPTFYVEWVERGGRQEKPNKYETKLLLADQFGQRLFYASNFIVEQEVSGERETELGWSHALSTPIYQRVLMGGIECLWTGTTTEGNRSHQEVAFSIGPSLQYRPTNRTFVDVVGLIGCTEDSPEAQMYVIFGYQFGTRVGPASGYISGPAATRGN